MADTNERELAEQRYVGLAHDYESNPIGSRDWVIFWNGWRERSELKATPLPADAALIGKLRHQLAQATDEAARLRALSQPAKLGFREHLALHATDDRKRLRELVDVVWNEATDSETVPSTITADELIDRVMSQPEVAQVPAGIWMREFVDAVEREAFNMRAPNTHTPVLVGMCIEARRRLLSAAPSAKGGEG